MTSKKKSDSSIDVYFYIKIILQNFILIQFETKEPRASKQEQQQQQEQDQ